MATLAEEIKALADKHLTPLKEQEKDLKKQLSDVQAQIASAEQLLNAAGGGKKKKPAGSTASANRKPSADVEKVTSIMIALLEQNGDLGRDDLQGLVKAKLGEEGFAATGLSNRFAKILDANPAFAVKGQKVKLEGVAA